MKTFVWFVLTFALVCRIGLVLAGQEATGEGGGGPRFISVDVYADSGSRPLAAWQFEWKDPEGRSTVAGVEGGEHPAFRDPPYYDPEALATGRLIVASFHTGDELPTGRTRIATLHLRIVGEGLPAFELEPMTAAARDGERFSIELSFEEGSGK